MIAPARETPAPARHSALRAARLAVADALLSRCHDAAGQSEPLASWKVWLLVGSLILVAVGYLLTGDWWTVEKY